MIYGPIFLFPSPEINRKVTLKSLVNSEILLLIKKVLKKFFLRKIIFIH